MQTTPPIVSASTGYGVAVQCTTRNTAQVAISVAMVMPLIGFDELPIRPLMREATVTNRNPKTTTKSAARKSEKALVCAPGIGLNFSSAHIIATITAEPTTTTRMERSRSVRLVSESAGLPRANILDSGGERRKNRRHGLDQRDQAGSGDRARAHRTNVAAQSWSGVICGIGTVLG